MDATVIGLESVTVGNLARETGISKSGILTVFGTREKVLLAAVDQAREIYLTEVIEPARTAPRGTERLIALLDAWESYVRREVFPGGCFLANASVEFAGQTGPVADRVRDMRAEWLTYLTRQFSFAGFEDAEGASFRFDAYLAAGVTQAKLFTSEAPIRMAIRAAASVVSDASK